MMHIPCNKCVALSPWGKNQHIHTASWILPLLYEHVICGHFSLRAQYQYQHRCGGRKLGTANASQDSISQVRNRVVFATT